MNKCGLLVLQTLLLTLCLGLSGIKQELVYGSPESVGLLSAPLKELEANISDYMTAANYGSASYNVVHPLFPGATVLCVFLDSHNIHLLLTEMLRIGHNNTIVSHFAVGQSRKYSDVNGTLLPEDSWIATQKNTIYDMASLTKMFTTIVGMEQLDTSALALNATVASYIPEFAVNGKDNVTILQLFTHTSGFDADPVPGLGIGCVSSQKQTASVKLTHVRWATYEERKAAILSSPLIHEPGTATVDALPDFMTLQFVLELITGLPLDKLIETHFTGPLGMKDSFFNRGNKQLPANLLERIAVTEFQIGALGDDEPQRPQPVWGTVHDENAWSLNGVAGHAGMFSTAKDLAIFCQMILNNGTYNGVKILEASTVDLIFYDFNGEKFPGNNHGLGFELNQYYWSGPMQSLRTAGHTGFTGTTLVIDRRLWILASSIICV
ncbi:hypothetical protein H0H93_009695 [Arthromyces matolae]|nr:hypothetical protein H0H93_009695 [Arthromyces matolae]